MYLIKRKSLNVLNEDSRREEKFKNKYKYKKKLHSIINLDKKLFQQVFLYIIFSIFLIH